MQRYKLKNTDGGFPATSVIKPMVHMIHIALKGGLDANTQQYDRATFDKSDVQFV
jgi:hypothetical protein